MGNCACWEGLAGQTKKPAVDAKQWASPTPLHRQHSALDFDSDQRRPDTVLKQNSGKKRSKFEVEQLMASPGNLPTPLSAAERRQAIERLLPTARHGMLEKVPANLLEAASSEGQALRRRLMDGATVVFFTAGYPGKRFVFERAHELGIRSVVIEHPDSWAKDLVADGIISKFLPCDMSRSSDVIFEEALKLIQDLGKDGTTGKADAVLTFVELSIPVVARLCEVLGLPGSLPAAVDAARDKHRTRAALKDAGLPTPRNYLIHSEKDLDDAASHVKFPAILKPISGAASLGVKKVPEAKDLLPVYREVARELSSLVVMSGALAQNNGSNTGVAAGSVIDMTLLLEQYLDGDEVDVDVIVSDGEWRYAAVTDNGPTIEPYFNETWGVCPSLLDVHKQRALKELAVNSVAALGFKEGVFHVECKYTSTGPQLIEVNARMGGGPVHEHNKRTWGVDLVEEAFLIALGIPSRPEVPKMPIEPMAYYLVPAKKSGTVVAMPGMDALVKDPGFIWARQLVTVGGTTVGPEDGLPTWVWDVAITRPTAREAVDVVLRWEEENEVQVK